MGLLPATATHLVETYGARWQRTLTDTTRIQKGLPHIWGEVDVAVREEDARTVGDVMLRRTDLGFGPKGRMGVARKVARRLQTLLSWTDAQREAHLEAYRAEAEQMAVPDLPQAKD